MTGRHATITVGYLARNEEIGRRAYEIHLEREQPGREPDDWLQAERELEGGVLSHVQAGWEADRQHSWVKDKAALLLIDGSYVTATQTPGRIMATVRFEIGASNHRIALTTPPSARSAAPFVAEESSLAT